MKLVNRLFRNKTAHAVACWLIARYIRLVELTSRWTLLDTEAMQEMTARGEPFIAAFWHGRMVLMPGTWRRIGSGRAMRMLISMHRDGVTISKVIAHLGIETIAGSTSRGGTGALHALIRTLRAGGPVGITPDGPRGPRMRASPGLATVASRMSVPVFAVSFSATRRKLFRSWDRFLLPLPFGRPGARNCPFWSHPGHAHFADLVCTFSSAERRGLIRISRPSTSRIVSCTVTSAVSRTS